MSTIVSQLYNSRKILLGQLARQGFNVEDYEHFSFNEIRVMFTNKQLDMLLNNPKTLILDATRPFNNDCEVMKEMVQQVINFMKES